MLPSQRRVIHHILACRTPALGGHLWECLDCGEQRAVYHSCRDRHCPTCQTDHAQRWLDKQRSLLLPCDHYLITCTLPEELRPLARYHQRIIYDILIREAARAVMDLGSDPEWVGGRLALMAILHTWARSLIYHPHVHILVPAGGLLASDNAWIKPARPRFLMPGYAISKRFRTRFEAALKNCGLHSQAPESVWHKDWVCHVKRVGAGEKALLYLSRYVFRVAISNDRIEFFDGERVTFRWTDSRTGRTRRCTLSAHQFIARFLKHVLPPGFVKVRYYGLWAPTCRRQLEKARSILLDHPATQPARVPIAATPLSDDSRQHSASHPCPSCGATTWIVSPIPARQREPP